MTREVVLELWLQGGRLCTIAKLLGEDPHGVEDAVRMELQRIRDEFQSEPNAAAPAEPEALPPPQRAKRAASSFEPSARRKNMAGERAAAQVRRRIGAALDLTGYPASLQDPRAERQRKVYDALKAAPSTTMELQGQMNLTSANVSSTIHALRAKGLIIGSETIPVAWRLA